MIIRHLVAADNVDVESYVIDPARVRHGTIRAGSVEAIAAEIDAPTHLNRDFPAHALDVCIVVEALAVGAAVRAGDDGFVVAGVRSAAFESRGAVDVQGRRIAWQTALRERRA